MRLMTSVASATVIAAAFTISQPADAASLLSISGVDDLAVPVNNDLLPTPNGAFRQLVPLAAPIGDGGGLFWSQGAQLSTTADNVTLSFNYIGSLGAATNTFSTSGGSFTTLGLDEAAGGDSTAQDSFSVVQASAGLVDFTYSTTVDGSSVSNTAGNNPSGAGNINYSAAFLDFQRTGSGEFIWELSSSPTNVVLLLLDDSGAGPDLDFDDLGVVVVATPIPAALPLFATAIFGLGLMGWLRRLRA